MENLRSTPIRTCIACRKREIQPTLTRVALVDGKVFPNIKGSLHGRGAWLHRACIEAAISRGAFRWAFKLKEAPDVTELKKYLSDVTTEMDAKDMKQIGRAHV